MAVKMAYQLEPGVDVLTGYFKQVAGDEILTRVTPGTVEAIRVNDARQVVVTVHGAELDGIDLAAAVQTDS